MRVKELIEKLSELEPDAPVWTIDSDDCWPTFVEVEAAQIGEQYLADLRRYGDTVVVQTPSAVSANWTGRVVVIAGGTWSSYPNGDDDARGAH
ncbi:MAG: hypothetical protein OXC13_12775 [Caldilineaceae bacterium]|nr:hypothetical protein [Caldilineaceae bacterium]